MIHDVQLRVSEVEQQRNGQPESIRQTIDAVLRSDDRLLTSLQKLGWELETEDPEEKDMVSVLRESCARSVAEPLICSGTKLTPKAD